MFDPDSNSDDPAGFGVEVCPTARCDDRVDYGVDRQLEIGRNYTVTVQASPEGTVFAVPGVPEPRTVEGVDGIRDVRLYAYTTEGASFAVDVDDIAFRYAS